VNAGSLEKDLWEKYGAPNADALAESAKRWTNKVEKFGFQNFVVSLKSSRAAVMIEAYKKFAAMCPHVPLHLGVTEAGPGISGAVKCAVGIGSLLSLGIGNTIRVSTSGPIEEEIRIGKEILKSLGLYSLEPDLISCPGCGRAEVDINKLAKEVQKIICGINKPLRIAVMGCAVNALGEAREADFAIAGGKKCGALFMNGKLYASAVPEKELLKEFRKMLEENI
jgi:(E)-4-hydroxy-3-methylbut-2-enyl-diphosphate synthase